MSQQFKFPGPRKDFLILQRQASAFETGSKYPILRAFAMLLLATLLLGFVMTSCGFDTDQFINDLNDELENQGEIYYDPNCLDDDNDGWCD